jgi:hypothetical protein
MVDANVINRGQSTVSKRERDATIPVYAQFPFVAERASGCDIVTRDGRRILDLYGGHAVAALGYGHPRLMHAIHDQSQRLLFQSTIPFLCPFYTCYLAVFIISDYKNSYLLSILHLFYHFFAELVHLYNLPLYWVCWRHKRFLVFDCRVA